MKKKYLFMATAAIMMAGCASDDLVGDDNISSGETPIEFSMLNSNVTRAEDAHTQLSNMFIVWGEKNEGTDGKKASAANLVFKNYKVTWADNTANTTLSNTKNWEYVGIAPFTSTQNVSPYISETAQTIKYWDYQASSYTFTAVSAVESEITGGKVVIAKEEGLESSSTETKTEKDKGYTITIKNGATTDKIFVADRINIAKNTGTDRTAENAYGGLVKFSFRNFMTKIRFGFYETVPGYKVQITGVKYNSTATSPSTNNSDKLGVDGLFYIVPTDANGATKYTVTYENGTTSGSGAGAITTNKAKVSVDTQNSASANYKEFTATDFFNTDLGTAANNPTWNEKESNTGKYTTILPNPSNGTNLKLQIAYKLISEDTGEVIEFKEGSDVVYRTVEVPAAYCQWKPNYAYTYLFKISDKSAELYPITFDACVVESETGNQETITEVGEPSITTFAVKDGKIVTGKDEYEDGNTIYATIVEGSSLVTMSADNIKLYTVTATGTQTISEASVANCLAKGTKDNDSNPTTWTSTAGTGNVLTVTSKSYTASSDLLNAVPSEDGKTVTLDANNKKAIKWTATGSDTAATYYVVEYVKTDNSTTTKYYKIVKIAQKPSSTTGGGGTGEQGS